MTELDLSPPALRRLASMLRHPGHTLEHVERAAQTLQLLAIVVETLTEGDGGDA